MCIEKCGSIELSRCDIEMAAGSGGTQNTAMWREIQSTAATENIKSGKWQRHGKRLVLASAMLSGSLGLLSTGQVAAETVSGNPCVDSDGDGWGWDGENSCLMEDADATNEQAATERIREAQEQKEQQAAEQAAREEAQSLRIAIEEKRFGEIALAEDSITNGMPTSVCEDTDGDGWGWDGEESCLVNPDRSAAERNDSPDRATRDDSNIDVADIDNIFRRVDGPCVDEDRDGYGWNGDHTCEVVDSGLTPCTDIPREGQRFDHGVCADEDGYCKPYGSQNVQYFQDPCTYHPTRPMVERPIVQWPRPELKPCSSIPLSEQLTGMPGPCEDDEGNCRRYGDPRITTFFPVCQGYPTGSPSFEEILRLVNTTSNKSASQPTFAPLLAAF